MVRTWTDERIKRVKHMADSGMSATMIAVELDDGSTRNAVVGVGHRNSIKFHGGGGGPNYKAKPKVVLPVIETPPEPEPVGMLTIMELQSHNCRWPMGDPRDTDFRYCGQHISRQSYCTMHSRLAFETQEQRRARLR